MSDDLNKRTSEPIDETQDFLSRFDTIYDRIETETPREEDDSASSVSAGRVSRLKQNKFSFASLFPKNKEKEARAAAREERRAAREGAAGGTPETPAPGTVPAPSRSAGKPKKSFGEAVSDGAAEVVAALVIAHKRVHTKPDKTVKRVDRKALRNETNAAAVHRSVTRRKAASPGTPTADKALADPTIVIGAGEVTRERVRRENESPNAAMADKNTKRKKNVKYRKNGKPKRHIFLKVLLVLFCLGLLGATALGIWVMSIVKDTPDINPDNLYDMLSENTVIYDDKGEVLEYIYDSNVGLRTNLSFNEIPKDLVNAFIAIEDKTFWKHHGFNFVRIVGAIVNSLKTGDSISGTSTITQQLARNLYLVETKDVHTGLAGYTRKIQEAYYTLILERELSKKQIIEAYLNTIYLGQNSYGIYAASQTYFSKDVHELNLAETALLASIPKNPRANAPFRTLNNSAISDPALYDILYSDTLYTVVYQANYRNRLEQVLKNMEEYEMISHEQREEAKAYDLRSAIKPSREKTVTVSSYFADYVQSQVKTELMNEYNLTNEQATKMLQTGGLRIYTTIDTNIQKIADEAFADPANFPTLVNMSKDKDGNIIGKDNNILLYYYDSFFNADGDFVLKKGEYETLPSGDLRIFRGNRFNIYRVTSNGKTVIQPEFKNLYSDADGTFYQINGGVINIPATYMSRDDGGNLILSKNFLGDSNYRPYFVRQDDGSYLIKAHLFTLRQKTIQPQAAMVITDYHTGQIKCMVGGRTDTGGKLLYNRALSTRQPGSSIKPLTVYGAALQRSYDLVQSGNPLGERIFTAASVLDDAPTLNDIGEIWPKNSYNYYRGLNSLRRSVEQSINVNAVRVQTAIGNAASIEYATRFGITSFVTDSSKAANDLNPSALALGGMVNGVSTLQMASAYGTYPNGGVYQEPVCYTKVTNKLGDILLEKTSKSVQACDPGVAFIMTDILRTTVTNGIAGNAKVEGQLAAGKTGTTSDRFDIWFDGFTAHYAASLWIGNDTNIELSTSSSGAAKLWSKIMTAVHEGLDAGSYPAQPDNVVTATIDTQSGMLPSELTYQDSRGATIRTEYFLRGTEPTEEDTSHVEVEVCTESYFLATDVCREKGCVATVLRVKHPDDSNLIYTGRKLNDNFCIPMNYEYVEQLTEEQLEQWVQPKRFKYPDDLLEQVSFEITATTRFTTVKYYLPQEVIDDIYEQYGTVVTNIVGDYDYAAPVYYCYMHNTDPLGETPIDMNVIGTTSFVVPEYILRAVDPKYEGYTGTLDPDPLNGLDDPDNPDNPDNPDDPDNPDAGGEPHEPADNETGALNDARRELLALQAQLSALHSAKTGSVAERINELTNQLEAAENAALFH